MAAVSKIPFNAESINLILVISQQPVSADKHYVYQDPGFQVQWHAF